MRKPRQPYRRTGPATLLTAVARALSHSSLRSDRIGVHLNQKGVLVGLEASF